MTLSEQPKPQPPEPDLPAVAGLVDTDPMDAVPAELRISIPDTTRHFPTLFIDWPQTHPQVTSDNDVTPLGDHACHEVGRKLSPNGTKCTHSRSDQGLVTSRVTNNGPLTRKIPFVTAFPPIIIAISPIVHFVTKQRIDITGTCWCLLALVDALCGLPEGYAEAAAPSGGALDGYAALQGDDDSSLCA